MHDRDSFYYRAIRTKIGDALRGKIRQTAENHLVTHANALLSAAERPMASANGALELVSLGHGRHARARTPGRAPIDPK